MIIYSITTAIEASIEEKWVDFMKLTQIPSIMSTGLFVDFRFVRIIPSQGVDLSYNLQLRCKGYAELNRSGKDQGGRIVSDRIYLYN